MQTNQAYMFVFTPPTRFKMYFKIILIRQKTDLSLNAQIGCLEFLYKSLLFSLWKENKASLNNDEASLLYIQS